MAAGERVDERQRSVHATYSDGLETGDLELLAHQMKRLSLRARRVVWLNPLSAADGYAPLAPARCAR